MLDQAIHDRRVDRTIEVLKALFMKLESRQVVVACDLHTS